MELGRGERAVLHGRDERLPVLGPGDQRRRQPATRVERERAGRVGVHEVESGAGPMPASSRDPEAARTVFQPMCGRIGAVSRSTVPGHWPHPSVRTPCSTPSANSTCMPTQMPSTGLDPASLRSITTSPRTARNPAMHAANAPTPGTTSPSALSAVSASAVTVVSAPGDPPPAGNNSKTQQPSLERQQNATTVVDPRAGTAVGSGGSPPRAGTGGGSGGSPPRTGQASQDALGAGDAGVAGVGGDGCAECAGDGLELCFDDVVRVAAGDVQVQADARRRRH